VIGPPERLSPEDERLIREAQDSLVRYCRRQARALVGRAGPPPASLYQAVVSRVQRLGELAIREPDAQTEYGVTARTAIGDLAESFEGSNCDPRLLAEIERELAELPRE